MDANVNAVEVIEEVEIVGGPSREDLFDALRFAYRANDHFTVFFTVIAKVELKPEGASATIYTTSAVNARVVGLEHESGSGTQFNLKGYLEASPEVGKVSLYVGRRFDAYYDSHKRVGTMFIY